MSFFLISCCLVRALLIQSPHLSVKQPTGKPLDKEVKIQVERLEPFQEVEIQAEALDQKGNLWFSQATFHANAQGFVDLTSFRLIQPSSYENYGVSRGAELSLILGSFYSVQAIAAIVPSSVAYGVLSETPVNAWIYSAILPFVPVPQTDFEKGKGETPENPANTRQSFLEEAKDTTTFTAAAIPFENIRCPILLVSGGDDQMWPSNLYAQQIVDRLERNHSPIFNETLKLPSAPKHIMMKNNREKFSALKQLKLPEYQYAIIGSGPLGIRNLKSIGDIDIIVTLELWNDLAAKYGITDENGVRKIAVPGGIVEAFQEGSFYEEPFDSKAPNIASRIANAEMIDDLPFDAIENTLYYKRKSQREKDLKDILLIEEWMRMNKKQTD